MRHILTIIGLMGLLDLVVLVLFLYLTRGTRWKWLAIIFMSVQVLGLTWLIVGRLVGFGIEMPKFFLATTYLWHFLGLALFVPLLTTVVTGFLLVELRRFWVRRKSRLIDRDVAAPSSAFTRRQFIGAVLTVAPPLFTIGLTGVALRQLQQFRVRRLVLPIAGLPRDLIGLTIAHVSDMHVGRFTSERVLRDMVRVTNEFHPDLVLVTGDLINNALADLPQALETVRSIESRFGTWIVEGNHDLIDDAAEFRRRMSVSGLNFLLHNSAVTSIYGMPVQIFGVPWLSRRRVQRDLAIAESVESVLLQRHPDAFPILLGHHPHVFDTAARAAVPLTLSGHTHGGQFMVNEEMGAGPTLFKYWSGHYQQGDSHLVVSNGVGNWFPLRINAPAELVQITLAAG